MPLTRMKVAAGLVLSLCQPISAQELRGTVSDSVSRVLIPGAVLLIRDATGQPVGRSITNERGEYRVALSPGASQVRVLRLGFRPRDLALPALTGGIQELDIRVMRVPTLLDPVITVANPLCPRRSDQHAAFALWQHARSGLLATIVARESNPARAMVLVYQRILVGSNDSIAEQRVHADTGRWATPFLAAYSAADFVRKGFVEAPADKPAVYYGPDAEVLLDDAFQAAYCFAIARGLPSRSELVGLRFEPAKRRRGRVDIHGTLWIDTVARSLRDIEFRYVGLEPGTDRFRPGGRIEFREMPNGVVVIERWSLRIVQPSWRLSRPLARQRAVGERDRLASSRSPRYHVTDAGGELATAEWSDGTSWRAALGTLRIRLLDRRRSPLVSTLLQLDSTHYAAFTDSTGYLEIEGLLPGPYKGVIVDSTLESIGIRLRTPLEFVAARDSTVGKIVVAQSLDDVIEQVCRARPTPDSYMVIGRVITPDGYGVKGARWMIADQNGYANEDGLFMPCIQFAKGSLIEVRAWRGGGLFGDDVSRTITTTVTKKFTPMRVELPLNP